MNWLDAIINKLHFMLFHDKPDPVLVIVVYLIICFIAINYPSVQGG